jgi:hypothetical protein
MFRGSVSFQPRRSSQCVLYDVYIISSSAFLSVHMRVSGIDVFILAFFLCFLVYCYVF